jgi:uroporphyrinogen-III synthase
MSSGRVLVTRPSPDAEATAVLVADLGFEPVLAPMLVIERLAAPKLPARIDAVVLTSRNALPMLPASLRPGRGARGGAAR